MRQVTPNAMQGTIGNQALLPLNFADSEQKLPPDIEKLVNRIFDQLLASCPAMRSQFDAKQLATTKRQWILAFAENDIRTIEQVRCGMRQVRAKPDDFFPSVGKFIEWCGMSESAHGLPTPENLLSRYRQFRASDCETAEEFDWQSAVEYHLVLQLKRAIYHSNLSEEKALVRAKTLISDMAKYLRNGGMVAEPTVSKLPEAVIKPVSDEQKFANFKNLKAILRGIA